MKLLFDENLSPALAQRLAAQFPGSAHVRDVGMRGTDDLEIWHYTAEHDFIIVTKDDDFSDLSILHGAPPKVLLLRIGNCSSEAVSAILILNLGNIETFASDTSSALSEITGIAP